MKQILSRIFKKLSKKVLLGLLAILIIGAPLLYLNLLNSKSASAAWYSDSWHYRKKLTIDRTKVSGGSDLSNFPVLVSLADSELGKAQPTGNDIMFTSSDGSTKLDHEIESFTQSSGNLIAWVRIPTLSASANTDIYMYYGNSNTADQSNKNGVWSNSYEDVYHLKEDPSGSSPQVTNSTSTASMDGASSGTMTSSDLVTGKIGNAIDFDGTDDYIESTSNSSITGANHFTIEAWIKPGYVGDGAGFTYAHVALKLGGWFNDGSGSQGARLDGNEAGALFEGYSYCCITYAPENGISGQWVHVVGVYDGNNMLFYANGSLVNQFSASFNLTSDKVNIGSVGGRPFKGSIDEARVSNTNRSTGWITTEYNNQNDPGTFFSAKGSEETKKGPVLYLGFNEGQGIIAYDSSPSKNNGTLSGTTTPSWQKEDLCISGKCLYFEGSTAYIGVGSTTPNVQSVGFWVKPKTTTEPLALLDAGTHYISASGGTITATGFASPVIYVNGKVSSILTANAWQYVEVTTATSFSSASMKVGTNSTTYLNGFIDEFKVYDYQRSAAEVRTDYNSRGSIKGVSAQIGSQDPWLSNGLVGYWKMDESSWTGVAGEVIDASGNGNNGTASCNGDGCSIPSITTGKFGNSGSLSGGGDIGNGTYVDLGTNSALRPTTAITVGAWVNMSACNPWRTIVGSNVGFQQGVWFQVNGSCALQVGLQDVVWYSEFSTDTNAISTGSWQHVLFTYDSTKSTNNGNIYANGVLVKSVTLTGNISYSGVTNTYLGMVGSDRYHFSGSMDELRIYNRALSPKEVRDLYEWAPGPVGYWRMDDKVAGDSKTIVDSSGNGINGTTILGANNTGMDCTKPGKYGGGCQFDGVDDGIGTGGTSLNLSSAPGFTIEAWVNPTSFTSWYNQIYENGVEGNSLTIYDDGSQFTVMAGAPWATLNAQTSAGVISKNQWVHLATVYDRSNLYIYINGVQKAITAGTNNPGSSNNSGIGARVAGVATNGFPGLIDEVKVYNYARTQKQIVSDMNAGHPAVGSPIGSAVGYWDFDEGYSITAKNYGNGGTTLNGTLTGASHLPAWTNAGKYGKAISFDGIDDFVKVTNSSTLNLSSAATFSVWIYPTSASSFQDIIRKTDASTADKEIAFSTARQARFYLYNVMGGVPLTSNSVLALNNWYHIVGTYDGSVAKIYINGKLDSSKSASGTIANSTADLYIGSSQGTSQFFTGSIDEPKIYNYALTADEVKTEYNKGSSMVLGALGNNPNYQINAANQEYCVPGDSPSTSCAAPLLLYDFNEKSGITAYDKGSGANNGTLTNSPTWSVGKYGGGINFSGTNDYVNAGSAVNLDNLTSGNFTVETWFKQPTALSGGDPIYPPLFVKHGAGAWGWNFQYYWTGTNYESWFFQDTDATNMDYRGTLNIIPGKWHHFVGVYTNTTKTARIFFDGKEITYTYQVPGTGSARSDSDGNLTIGSQGGYEDNFVLDEVKIFNYARTPAQIAWDYNKGKPVGWWRFDECSGATVKDYSGNANNGTITIGTGAGTGHQDSAGTCTDGTGATAWNNGATGKRNYSLNLDGIDDYVNISGTNFPSFGDTAFSFSTWVYITSLPGTNRNIFIQSGAAGSFDMWLNGSGQVNVAAIGSMAAVSQAAIPINQWSHIVYVLNGHGNNAIYINGKADPLPTNVTVTFTDTALDKQIGQSGDVGINFKGQIDDVKIFNYALTGTQIKNEYNGGAVNYGPSTGSP